MSVVQSVQCDTFCNMSVSSQYKQNTI